MDEEALKACIVENTMDIKSTATTAAIAGAIAGAPRGIPGVVSGAVATTGLALGYAAIQDKKKIEKCLYQYHLNNTPLKPVIRPGQYTPSELWLRGPKR